MSARCVSASTRMSEASSVEDGVGASAISFDRDRDLRSPSNPWSEAQTEALEQREMRFVANRVTIGMQLKH